METTVAVKESTAQILAKLKKKLQTKSIDETINKLLQKAGETKLSRFGFQPKLKEFSEKDRGVFREL